MENQNSESTSSTDWKKVLIEIIVKILTLGFYHVEKHRKQAKGAPV